MVSSVGGATFDRVWRLELPEGRVALINVSGTSGAELGLYLFDEFSRSVTSSAPIAQSAKPGGSQSISTVLTAGTYYIDVNGRNTDRAYGFTLSVALLGDTTPPTLLLRPAPNGASVNSGTAVVQVIAGDLLSGVESMRFRVDGGEWGAWSPALSLANVAIPTVRGMHRIDAQVTNRLGLVSAIATTNIIYDDIVPTATRTSPRADGTTTLARPFIEYQFSEPMRASSWLTGGLVVLSRSGSIVPGKLTYDPSTRIGRWVATEALGLGEPYAVQLGGVVDLAGNAPASPAAWLLQYQLSTAITVETTSITTTYLALRTMIGTMRNVPVGATVLLEQRLPGGEWATVSNWVAGSVPLRVTYRPTQTAQWRLRYDGDSGRRVAVSNPVNVKVSAKLTLSGAGGYVRTRTSGATVQIRGTASPVSSGLTLVRYRCNSLFTGCTIAAQIPVVADELGQVSYAWNATRGYWIWKLKSTAGAGLEAGTTARLRFTVR